MYVKVSIAGEQRTPDITIPVITPSPARKKGHAQKTGAAFH